MSRCLVSIGRLENKNISTKFSVTWSHLFDLETDLAVFLSEKRCPPFWNFRGGWLPLQRALAKLLVMRVLSEVSSLCTRVKTHNLFRVDNSLEQCCWEQPWTMFCCPHCSRLLTILFNAAGTTLFEPDSSTGMNNIGATAQIRHDNIVVLYCRQEWRALFQQWIKVMITYLFHAVLSLQNNIVPEGFFSRGSCVLYSPVCYF